LQLLKSIGDDVRPSELKDLISCVDADGNALIDYAEFLVLVSIRSAHKYSADEIVDAFRVFDPDGTGMVRVSVFREAFSHLSGGAGPAGVTSPSGSGGSGPSGSSNVKGVEDKGWDVEELIREALAISRDEAARRKELQEARDARRFARRKARAALGAGEDDGGAERRGEDPTGGESPPAPPLSSSLLSSPLHATTFATWPPSNGGHAGGEHVAVRMVEHGETTGEERSGEERRGEERGGDVVSTLYQASLTVGSKEDAHDSGIGGGERVPEATVAPGREGEERAEERGEEDVIFYETFVRLMFSY
jgi:hypothetical protein